MKEHKLGFIRVYTKTKTGKPLAAKRGEALKLRDHTGKGLTSGKDASVIHIKGEIGITRAIETKLK